MMTALREGRTLRSFGVKAPRLEAYFQAHPEYAQEARPLIEANATGGYFHKNGFRKGRRITRYVNIRHIRKAVEFFGGELTIDWKDV